MYLSGEEIPSNQYSVTRYERDLAHGNMPTRDSHGREFLRWQELTSRRYYTRHQPDPWTVHQVCAMSYPANQQLRDLSHESYPHGDAPVLCALYHFVCCIPSLKSDARTCAIIGGVLTVASLLDAAIFTGRKHITGKEYDGYGGVAGKMVGRLVRRRLTLQM